MSRKVILYIAMSIDGYIAKEDGNIDFLEMAGDEDYGYNSFLKTVDTVLWGRKTYDKVCSFGIEFPHKERKVFVLSGTRTGSDDNVFYFDDVEALLSGLHKQSGLDIYCDGGGELVFELMKYSLIDRMIISVIPHILGNGIRLFRDGRPESSFRLKQVNSYSSGVVQLWYDKQADMAG